jgi:hypothetical protein
VPDAVDLDRGQRQVTAGAAAPDEPGRADAAEPIAQGLVLGDEPGRHAFDAARTGARQLVDLRGHRGLCLGDGGDELHGLCVERDPLLVERPQLALDRLELLHELEHLVLEHALAPAERGHLVLHRLQLAWDGDRARVELTVDLGGLVGHSGDVALEPGLRAGELVATR